MYRVNAAADDADSLRPGMSRAVIQWKYDAARFRRQARLASHEQHAGGWRRRVPYEISLTSQAMPFSRFGTKSAILRQPRPLELAYLAMCTRGEHGAAPMRRISRRAQRRGR